MPSTEILFNKARTQEEAVKIRNLGLACAIYKNQIRPLVKLDRTTVLRKLNYMDDALVQLYYLLVLN